MEHLNVFFFLISSLTLIQLLLRLFVVEGKAVFNDQKLKRRYAWTQTGLSTMLIIPMLLLLYRLPEKTALPSAVGMVSLIYAVHALVEFKYVRGTKEHVVSGIMAAIHAAFAIALYLIG